MILSTYQQVLAHYQLPLPPNWAQALEEKSADGTLDLGDLDEQLQQEVLENPLPPRLAVINKLGLKRSNFTLGKYQKLVEQHRMDKIGNLAKKVFEPKHFLLLEVIFPKCCNFSKVPIRFV
ncbi:MAG: hypothetical protein NZ602_01780 [Thermoguttaceae bacterium]|nr:hypothetical protein [Thermoguttaceae bacterium]MDW8036916.1 hypothetical protein [Thermoguttaceae bacterium]